MEMHLKMVTAEEQLNGQQNHDVRGTSPTHVKSSSRFCNSSSTTNNHLSHHPNRSKQHSVNPIDEETHQMRELLKTLVVKTQ